METIDEVKMIEALRQDHLLLCEELTHVEQINMIPGAESGEFFKDRRNGISDDREVFTEHTPSRMQTRRRLDEVAYCHGMGASELKTHLERSTVLGDCLLCDWFVRGEGGFIAY